MYFCKMVDCVNMPNEGERAPQFKLDGSDGKPHSLDEFRGRYLVLYFYPRDDTPGCTIEAKEFTAKLADFRKLGADVVGISKDDYDSHCKFSEKHGLKVLLLSDPSAKTIRDYDSWGNRGVFGEGILRKTFLIGKDGKILKDFGKVNPVGHADSVLSTIRQIGGK
jgi:peroxiredoxin Q/BCP